MSTACLALSKILENWEIGHNVMHGQWDWMRDPEIHSSHWEWDTYMLFFDLMLVPYGMELEKALEGEEPLGGLLARLSAAARKTTRLAAKEYLLFPLLSGPSFLPTLIGNLTAGTVRNVWSAGIVICGHFPADTAVFDEAQITRPCPPGKGGGG
ncbi:hypothetical protein E1298_00265 [Actinomadura rubrisoli]|uniref:Uncharacterized protein n=2 Tax=Actinomadura rubrisoli TaxID=2530368 RepID=A0A4V2YZQ7_9ACTN|nr:hypothetical protein E1298_00265 [Actinomadura rubrisoli]